MVDKTERIEDLKTDLNSANTQKLVMEREVVKYRNIDRNLTEDISITKEEIDFLQTQLEEIQAETSKVQHQISMIEICKTSEKVKIDAHINVLQNHRKGFDALFEKMKDEAEQHSKDIRDREAERQELLMQKQMHVVMKNEEHLQQAVALEAECDDLERECSVLKKRNTAIMLKLRRKLIENEDIRRDLLKKAQNELNTNRFEGNVV